MKGFYISRLAVVGRGKEPAELTFRDGLNVVSGASDTGKSYAQSCIDFVLGSSTRPREIAQAAEYDAVLLNITPRQGDGHYEIRRSLAGGDVEVTTYAKDNSKTRTEILPASHSSDNRETLSGFLLSLSGLWGKRVRKNADGEMRGLSFRDVSFLTIVDEVRIISQGPPQLSGQYTDRTVESDAYRLLITGVESPPVIRVTKKQKDSAKSQRDLILRMVDEHQLELRNMGILEDFIQPELDAIESTRERALRQYDEARAGVVALESEKGEVVRRVRELQSRRVITEALVQRFELLARHYDSDLDRLALVEQTGQLLESFPAQTCPVCGSDPKHHRPEACAPSFNLEVVRTAARAEARKVERLKTDLAKELDGIRGELTAIDDELSKNREKLSFIEGNVEKELLPRVRLTADAMNKNVARRDFLLRAKGISDRLAELRRREAELTPKALQAALPSPVASSEPSTAGMTEFAKRVEQLLVSWNFPDVGRISFSETQQDVVIGGQIRDSHGKGVRAMTFSSVIIGLMQHCIAKELPHPSFVVLDSPLVAYKEPDPGVELEEDSRALRQAGVKEAFYRTLAETTGLGQVIIFENDDPPESLQSKLNYVHFSRSDAGRYGFFPLEL